MLSALLILAAAASAADVVHADIRAATDFLHPAVLVGFNPQPDPPIELENDGRTATSAAPSAGREPLGVVLGVAEERVGVSSVTLVDGRTRIVVFGEGAAEQFLPPDPCFQLVAVLGDGTEVTIDVQIEAEGGAIDPGSLVGFNPQPDPPVGFPAAIQLNVRADAPSDVTVSISLSSGGAPLTLY